MILVRTLASMAIALLAAEASAQEEEVLLYKINCDAKSGWSLGDNDFQVELFFANRLGYSERVAFLFLDGIPKVIEGLSAEKDEHFKTIFRWNIDNINGFQRENFAKIISEFNFYYESYCLGKGDGEPSKSTETLQKNRMELLSAGVSVD